MKSLAVFHPANDAGQQLLDDFIRPLCTRYGLPVQVIPAGATRAAGLAVQLTRTFVVWDLSVEGPENVYAAMPMQAKLHPRNLLVSRTPLPRNVLGQHQCAPIHGHTFPNELLGEWLDRHLHEHLVGPAGAGTYPRMAAHYWMNEHPADYFLSFRGSHQAQAEAWRDRFEAAHGVSVRMVPPNEYSYPTEVVTRQQLWEGVARLMREIQATRRAVVLLSDDYYDSFWTASELLVLLWLAYRPPARGRQDLERPEVHFAASAARTDLAPLAAALDHGIPIPTSDHALRLVYLINNTDPVTSAPETQVPARGLGRLIARAVRTRYGYYQPEFQTHDFWHQVRVPCPQCHPHHRQAADVDWAAHMATADEGPVDYFGYFAADPADLASGRLTCPGCGNGLDIANRRGVRTLWSPVMSTEKDQDRPALNHLPLWEVV
ncbi:hypothetical protein Cs7R123_09020 [Catellatospora sp. TT07R-123]|uniref:hypothetical protein n=1 Tax=Catellatospora sp. TT07R-123 TaxID=2733863 RepID=UPI001B2D9ED8|nr:hypothetical protein [Catellatospora sp. TT07R-123]GHJ43560.1 hypothetical protein Cs7R123_09020 [Catellatospora sp. TT07R-123]